MDGRPSTTAPRLPDGSPPRRAADRVAGALQRLRGRRRRRRGGRVGRLGGGGGAGAAEPSPAGAAVGAAAADSGASVIWPCSDSCACSEVTSCAISPSVVGRGASRLGGVEGGTEVPQHAVGRLLGLGIVHLGLALGRRVLGHLRGRRRLCLDLVEQSHRRLPFLASPPIMRRSAGRLQPESRRSIDGPTPSRSRPPAGRRPGAPQVLGAAETRVVEVVLGRVFFGSVLSAPRWSWRPSSTSCDVLSSCPSSSSSRP